MDIEPACAGEVSGGVPGTVHGVAGERLDVQRAVPPAVRGGGHARHGIAPLGSGSTSGSPTPAVTPRPRPGSAVHRQVSSTPSHPGAIDGCLRSTRLSSTVTGMPRVAAAAATGARASATTSGAWVHRSHSAYP